MDFSVLDNVPMDLRPQARERLTLKQELKDIFPQSTRIIVNLPADFQQKEEINPQDNGGVSKRYTAMVFLDGGKLKLQGTTFEQLLQQARTQGRE